MKLLFDDSLGWIWVDRHGDIVPFIGGGVPPVSPPVSPPPPPPVAIPADGGLVPGALPGSLYVSGTALVYVSSDNHTWSGTGTAGVSPAGALAGSIWVDTNDVHYIGSGGVDYTLQRTEVGNNPVSGLSGSMWVDSPSATGKQLKWLGTTKESYWWNGV